MGSETDDIRQQIVETRDEMSQTMDALGHKADLPSQAKEGFQRTVSSVKDTLSGDVKDQMGQQGGKLKAMGERNPFIVIGGAVALGFLIGVAFPPTRFEERQLSKVSDSAQDLGQQALDRGKQVVAEAAGTAVEQGVRKMAG